MDTELSSTINGIAPQELAEKLKLKFTDTRLLNRAFTHRSYLNEHPEALEDNERLEFLGDAVLDFIVGAWLYNRFPEMAEGDLTRMRSALVHTHQLAEFARELGMGEALRLGKGEAVSGGRERSPILCDTFEAFIGAIYLDNGIDGVCSFISPMLERVADELLRGSAINDPKSRFQEWTQSKGLSIPLYVTRNSFGPEHSKVFEVDVLVMGEVYGSGSGHSKQAAAKAAAVDALTKHGIE